MHLVAGSFWNTHRKGFEMPYGETGPARVPCCSSRACERNQPVRTEDAFGGPAGCDMTSGDHTVIIVRSCGRSADCEKPYLTNSHDRKMHVFRAGSAAKPS